MGPMKERGSRTWMPPLHVFNTALNGCSFLLDIFLVESRIVASRQSPVTSQQSELANAMRRRGNFTYDAEANLSVLRIEEEA